MAFQHRVSSVSCSGFRQLRQMSSPPICTQGLHADMCRTLASLLAFYTTRCRLLANENATHAVIPKYNAWQHSADGLHWATAAAAAAATGRLDQRCLRFWCRLLTRPWAICQLCKQLVAYGIFATVSPACQINCPQFPYNLETVSTTTL